MRKYIFLILIFVTTITFGQSTIKHKVVSGESVYTIAKKYGVTEKDIFELNPKAKGLLQLDMVLTIPKVAIKKEEPKRKTPTGNIYTVQNGESFYTISRKFNVGYETLTELNSDIKPENLQIGEVIRLPKGVKVPKEEKSITINTKSKKEKPNSKNQKHIVASGESFYVIAKKYNISVEELRDANPQIENDKLDIRDVVFIPSNEFTLKEKKEKKETKPEKSKESTIVEDKKYDESKPSTTLVALDTVSATHRVVKGDTKFGISKKYGMTIAELEALNPDLKNLKAGQTIYLKPKTVITEKPILKSAEEIEIVSKTNDSLDIVPEYSASMAEKAEFLINKAKNYIGTRYRGGGTDTNGFDCSGFMFFTFKFLEMDLPHSSAEQATLGKNIKRKHAQKGDLIFFKTTRRGISHVGMITDVTDDEIKFIHSSTSQGVIISSLNEGYYSKRFVQINRVL